MEFRKMKVQARIEGKEQGWTDTDYAVLERERIVGRIYREMLVGEQKWRWFLNEVGGWRSIRR
jgi:hypothetical protein